MGEVISLPKAVLRADGPELHVWPDEFTDGYFVRLVKGAVIEDYQQTFRHAEDALVLARTVAKIRGWPVFDHTRPEPGEAA